VTDAPLPGTLLLSTVKHRDSYNRQTGICLLTRESNIISMRRLIFYSVALHIFDIQEVVGALHKQFILLRCSLCSRCLSLSDRQLGPFPEPERHFALPGRVHHFVDFLV